MSELTREQVVTIIMGLSTAVGGTPAQQDGQALRDTYAVLRQRVEILEKELSEVSQLVTANNLLVEKHEGL